MARPSNFKPLKGEMLMRRVVKVIVLQKPKVAIYYKRMDERAQEC